VPKHELLRSRIYNEWASPQGFHAVIGVVTALGPDAVGGLSLTRSRSAGDFEPDETALMRAMAPHLVRAVEISRRIGVLEGRCRLAEALLDAAAEPVVIVDVDMRVIHANAGAWKILMLADGLSVRGGKLAGSRHDVTTALLAGTRGATLGEPQSAGSLAVPRPSGGRAYALLVSPIPAGIVAGSLPALAAIFISDPEARAPDPTVLLRNLYGLTAAEAALVFLLATETPSLADVADRLGVAVGTVKTHLKRVYGKTGVRRQAELARLVLRAIAVTPRWPG
jgi:DNA-binding CsgD family transcriptional regulator